MAAETTIQASLYQRLGGHEVVAAAVDDFYRRVLADGELAAFFAGRDLDALRRHQAAFLDFVVGGPREYRGRPLRRAHAGLGIDAAQFARVVRHLAAALGACGVPDPLIGEMIGRVNALQREVVEG